MAARPLARRRELVPWALLAVVALLASVYAVAELSTPAPGDAYSTGLAETGSAADAAHILGRNLMVLALHALACVAGFIAGSSLPRHPSSLRGAWRTVHERAGPLAIGFVACATAFSLVTQVLTLGEAASAIASQLGLSE